MLTLLLGAKPAAADDKRPVPDYGGPPRPTTAGDVAAWPLRVVLFPPFVVNELVLRKPLGLLVVSAEKGAWVEKVQDFFAFGPRKQVTIFPSALFDFGLKPSVGFNLGWKYFLADPNTLSVHFGTWGPNWISVLASDTYKLDKNNTIGIEGSVVRRADQPFNGIGSFTKAGARDRYSSTSWAIAPTYNFHGWRSSSFSTRAGMRGLGFRDGGCCGEPALADELRAGRIDAPGFGQNYVGGYQAMSLVLDSRKPKPAPGTGIRIEAHEETVYTVENSAQSPRRSWIRWGGSIGGGVDLTGTQRVLSVSVDAEFADPLRGTVPFTDQVQLGGDMLMTGYLRSRLIDRSALVGTLQYRWPIWVFMDAVIHAAVGNVFAEHLDGMRVQDMRLSSGIGVISNASRESAFEVLVAGGTDPFSEGFHVSSFRLLFGSHHGF